MCRIVATVLSVDSSLAAGSPDDPCTKAPCRAMVRIDSVLGYGSAFPLPFTPGQVIRTRFSFTLSPTAVLLPSVKPPLPGLAAGSHFKTDVRSTERPGQAGADQIFVIDSYEVR